MKTSPFNSLLNICSLAHWIATWTFFFSWTSLCWRESKHPSLQKKRKKKKKKKKIQTTDNTYILYLSIYLSNNLSNRYCLPLCFHLKEQFINGKTEVQPILLELEAFLPNCWCWSIVRLYCTLSLTLTLSSEGSYSLSHSVLGSHCFYVVAKSPSKNSKICEARTYRKSTLSVPWSWQVVWSHFWKMWRNCGWVLLSWNTFYPRN